MKKPLFVIWSEKATEPGGINAMADLCAEIERRFNVLDHHIHEVLNDEEDIPRVFTDEPEAIMPMSPAPIQSSEIRIRPDDMVMVKWVGFDKPAPMKMSDIAKHDNYHVEWLSPIQPVRREWKKFQDDEVWYYPRFGGRMGQVRKISMHSLVQDDLYMPVLSPDETAPEGPEVK